MKLVPCKVYLDGREVKGFDAVTFTQPPLWRMGWKVVREYRDKIHWTFIDGLTASRHPGTFISAYGAAGQGRVLYRYGVPTVPREGCGPLTCFAWLQAALHFITAQQLPGSPDPDLVAVRCMYKRSTRSKRVIGVPGASVVWVPEPGSDIQIIHRSMPELPTGTVTADCVVLLPDTKIDPSTITKGVHDGQATG